MSFYVRSMIIGGARLKTEAGIEAGLDMLCQGQPGKRTFGQSENYATHMQSIAVKLID